MISCATEASSEVKNARCGLILAFSETGAPLVEFSGNSLDMPVPARSVVPLRANDVGAEVLLVFDDGDPTRPIIVGVMQTLSPEQSAPQITVDGKSLLVSGEREIVLRCGNASITLTHTGKVLIRGAYVLSRSTGANHVKGASVQIN